MDDRRRALAQFMSLHAHRARPTERPCVHLQFRTAGEESDLVVLDEEDLAIALSDGTLDRTAELVRWMLHQLATYDYATQRIVGIVFEPTVVLTEVLRQA